jgi:hypothetical protein
VRTLFARYLDSLTNSTREGDASTQGGGRGGAGYSLGQRYWAALTGKRLPRFPAPDVAESQPQSNLPRLPADAAESQPQAHRWRESFRAEKRSVRIGIAIVGTLVAAAAGVVIALVVRGHNAGLGTPVARTASSDLQGVVIVAAIAIAVFWRLAVRLLVAVIAVAAVLVVYLGVIALLHAA